jgi:transposase
MPHNGSTIAMSSLVIDWTRIAMRKVEIEDAEMMRIAIRQEIERSGESRYDHRLHGLLLVAHGQSGRQVAELLGEDARTVQRWVSRFETHGFAGLREGERPGRPSRISAEAWNAIGQDLRRSPLSLGYTQANWDGKLLSEHLRARHRLKLGVRQCQRIFNQMGFRRRKPRPVVAQADPERQAAFKKTAPTRKKRAR